MGCNLLSTIAVWTFLYLVKVLSADQSLFHDLGLNALPDVTKINISQEEYTRMMSVYLNIQQNQSADPTTIPEFITFYMVRRDWWPRKSDAVKLKFPIRTSKNAVDVDNSQLRILAPASSISPVRVQVNQVLGKNRRRLIDDKLIYLSENLTKWCEFDVSSAVQSWLNGERNLGIELKCLNCEKTLNPLDAAISVLVYSKHKRYRRSLINNESSQKRRTDCNESRRGKRKCCRHDMDVTFSELQFPEMKSILQPLRYDAGFCQGQCPPKFNHATNHSRIQSLIHQMDRKNAKTLNRRAVPKACCAPIKLEPLEILRVNPHDSSKLVVEKWDNMKVIECACS